MAANRNDPYWTKAHGYLVMTADTPIWDELVNDRGDPIPDLPASPDTVAATPATMTTAAGEVAPIPTGAESTPPPEQAEAEPNQAEPDAPVGSAAQDG